MLLLDNFFGTPHLGGTADEVIANHSQMVVDDLKSSLMVKPSIYS